MEPSWILSTRLLKTLGIYFPTVKRQLDCVNGRGWTWKIIALQHPKMQQTQYTSENKPPSVIPRQMSTLLLVHTSKRQLPNQLLAWQAIRWLAKSNWAYRRLVIQIAHWVPNVTFRKPLFPLIIENLLVLCIGSLYWYSTRHYWNTPNFGSGSWGNLSRTDCPVMSARFAITVSISSKLNSSLLSVIQYRKREGNTLIPLFPPPP